jgi:hypothetical protein
MPKRISPLFPGLPFWGWVVLGWTWLAHGSTAAFVISVGHDISKWLATNGWAGSLAGFIILTLAVIWPDLKPRMPWLKRPKTLDERLAIVETTHLPMLTKQLTYGGERFGTVEKQVNDLSDRLASLKRDAEAIDRNLRTVPTFSECLSWLSVLEHEATAIGDELENGSGNGLFQRFSKLKARPFSAFWKTRAMDGESPEEREAINKWGTLLIRHVTRCKEVELKFLAPVEIFDDNTGALYRFSKGPNCDDLLGDQCLFAVRTHKTNLQRLRFDYAARFADDAKRKATTS